MTREDVSIYDIFAKQLERLRVEENERGKVEKVFYILQLPPTTDKEGNPLIEFNLTSLVVSLLLEMDSEYTFIRYANNSFLPILKRKT